eukprot:9027082-Pyramimonas_sp.AAC.1
MSNRAKLELRRREELLLICSLNRMVPFSVASQEPAMADMFQLSWPVTRKEGGREDSRSCGEEPARNHTCIRKGQAKKNTL